MTSYSDDVEGAIFQFGRGDQKKAFNKLRTDFKKRTGKDVCDIVRNAYDRTMNVLVDMDKRKDSKGVRVELWREFSYAHALRWCKQKGD